MPESQRDRRARAKRLARAGQILPGVTVVQTPPDHPRLPGLPVVIFPGNVGDEYALADAVRRLAPGVPE